MVTGRRLRRRELTMRPNTASNSITAIAGARSNGGQADKLYESSNRIAPLCTDHCTRLSNNRRRRCTSMSVNQCTTTAPRMTGVHLSASNRTTAVRTTHICGIPACAEPRTLASCRRNTEQKPKRTRTKHCSNKAANDASQKRTPVAQRRRHFPEIEGFTRVQPSFVQTLQRSFPGIPPMLCFVEGQHGTDGAHLGSRSVGADGLKVWFCFGALG